MRPLIRGAFVFAIAVSVFAPAAASAQDLPPPPAEIPPLPEPVSSTLEQVVGMVAPQANDTAQALAPVAEASGFAFRPACSTVGAGLVALVLAGAYVPVPNSVVAQAVGPFLIYCAYTYGLGPADPVFMQLDAAVGPAITEQTKPVVDQAAAGLAPVHGQLAAGCGYSPLLAAPLASVPAPFNRVDLVKLICG
ncbi:MAG: hypothetical protein ACRDKJ_07750 [Actinomycetota bacterium]